MACQGMAWQAGLGWARHGMAGQGVAGQAKNAPRAAASSRTRQALIPIKIRPGSRVMIL